QFFSIFAFATCGGYSGSVSYLVSCNGNPNITVTVPFGYPFRLNQAVFTPPTAELCNKTGPGEVHLVGDFSSSAQFFVTVAVFAFLYSMAALAVYLGYLHLYR
ncbi:SYPL1 protein, partial [Asarcornis scutulata]|nr:SYPL1 protein [Asarcornis scutulata]